MSKSIKSKFKVCGFFYELEGVNCRRFLKLKLNGYSEDKLDLRVIMMNPGSSKSFEADYLDKWTPTEPDMTQSYIMKLMLKFNFKYAIILNLSDIREKDSNLFYYKLGLCEGKNINTSIFKKTLNKEEKELLDADIPTIAAWGVNDVLNELAKIVVNKYGDNLIGFRKVKTKNCTKFYHPMIRAKKGNGWVDNLTKELIEKGYVYRKTNR